jgi:hypothetical protein
MFWALCAAWEPISRSEISLPCLRTILLKRRPVVVGELDGTVLVNAHRRAKVRLLAPTGGAICFRAKMFYSTAPPSTTRVDSTSATCLRLELVNTNKQPSLTVSRHINQWHRTTVISIQVMISERSLLLKAAFKNGKRNTQNACSNMIHPSSRSRLNS